jgi:hypothetical protein
MVQPIIHSNKWSIFTCKLLILNSQKVVTVKVFFVLLAKLLPLSLTIFTVEQAGPKPRNHIIPWANPKLFSTERSVAVVGSSLIQVSCIFIPAIINMPFAPLVWLYFYTMESVFSTLLTNY